MDQLIELDYNISSTLCGYKDCIIRCIYYDGGQIDVAQWMQCSETLGGIIFCKEHRDHKFHENRLCERVEGNSESSENE